MAYHQHTKRQNMKAKSAVDWLIEKFLLNDENIMQIMIQAKLMEKEQIEEAFELGELNENSYQHTGRKIHKDKQEFYIKTYKN